MDGSWESFMSHLDKSNHKILGAHCIKLESCYYTHISISFVIEWLLHVLRCSFVLSGLLALIA